MSRSMLLHRGTFARDLIDPKVGITQGALVIHTNGLYFYHDGTQWTPVGGLSCVDWIKMFHVTPPSLEDDEFGIVAGLVDDHRALDDTWDKMKLCECLNSFTEQFPGEYHVWPEGQVMHPLRKSRMLSARKGAKRTKVANSVDAVLDRANWGSDRRKSLMSRRKAPAVQSRRELGAYTHSA